MPSSDPVPFSRPLRQAILARHQPAPRAPANDSPETETDPVRPPALVSEEVLKTETAAAYEKGLEAGRSAEKKTQAAALAGMRQELHAILEKVANQGDTLAAEVEALLPDLILEGVGRVLHTLKPEASAVKAIVEELLQGIDADDRNLRLSLHPEDADLLEEVEPDLATRYPGLTLIREPGLHRAECLLESRFGIADARFSAKLNNLRKVLE